LRRSLSILSAPFSSSESSYSTPSAPDFLDDILIGVDMSPPGSRRWSARRSIGVDVAAGECLPPSVCSLARWLYI
jgi:hypothetical protein